MTLPRRLGGAPGLVSEWTSSPLWRLTQGHSPGPEPPFNRAFRHICDQRCPPQGLGSTGLQLSGGLVSPRPWTRTLGAVSAAGALITGILVATTAPAPARHPDPRADQERCLSGSADRQAVFARAARVSGVPRAVLLGVSYLESRWDDHAGSPSTAGGFGPMHLTHVVAGTPAAQPDPLGK